MPGAKFARKHDVNQSAKLEKALLMSTFFVFVAMLCTGHYPPIG